MLKSMTGFGRVKDQKDGYILNIEIKSLNSKFLDAQVKLPRLLMSKDLEVRSLLSKELTRGKVSLSIDLENTGVNAEQMVNEELFKSYYQEYMKLASDVGANTSDIFRLALHSPDVMVNSDNDEEAEQLWLWISDQLAEALHKINEFRSQEGDALTKELSNYINSIATGLEQIKNIEPERIPVIKERIQKHSLDIQSSDDFDKNRFEQEMIYYIEKLDISEELVRLDNHLNYFLEVQSQNDSQGKKLGFISQEIGREINTIGSKANYAPVQKLVVDMKDELEKIKEQLLNVV